MAQQQLLGKQGESHVEAYLKRQGYTIIALNYTQFVGEIDIIAHKEHTICFVEVKTRTKPGTFAGHLVPYKKQQKIIAAAQHFIAQSSYTDVTYRFDVALVTGALPQPTITYFPHAFSQQGTV